LKSWESEVSLVLKQGGRKKAERTNKFQGSLFYLWRPASWGKRKSGVFQKQRGKRSSGRVSKCESHRKLRVVRTYATMKRGGGDREKEEERQLK